MNEFDYFKVFILYSGNVATNIDHLYIKRIHLLNFSYIVIEDKEQKKAFIALAKLVGIEIAKLATLKRV
jgi:hypothetical protein